MDTLAVRNLLLLKTIPGWGCSKINNIINKLNNINNLLNYSHEELLGIGFNNFETKYILKPNWSYVNNQIKLAKENHVEIISVYDDYYPRLLKHIYDPPVLLYILGNKKILSSELFAIVGTRNPTIYGKQMAKHFASELQTMGYIIVSGFAKGIDITAHTQAMAQNIPTIVVLGTSVDYIYPVSHKKYVNRILDQGGVIISENGFTTYPQRSCFPRRNRIISGLSKGVLVVEAARKSGSLISARCAMEQSREVFAVPGNINNPQALGCLDLISNGAKLVIDAQDIFEELRGIRFDYSNVQQHLRNSPVISSVERVSSAIKRSSTHIESNREDNAQAFCISPDQVNLLNSVAGGVTSFDQIVNNSSLDAGQVAAKLIQLELMGLITEVPGGYLKTGSLD